MDDFSIWTEVLDAKEIREIMEKGILSVTGKEKLAVFWAKVKS
jgi:hypothetical protein